MNRIVNRVFATTLSELEAVCANLKEVLNSEVENEAGAPDIDYISDVDNAIEGVLSARNAYCEDREIPIEDGCVDWSTSKEQREQDEEEAGEAQ